MKRSLLFAVMLLAVLIPSAINASRAQIPPTRDRAPAKEPRKRKLRLGLVGYLLLPEGYRAYRTEDLRDAWYGYIVSPDDKIRINWSAGMVQTPFQEGEEKFLWVKREKIPKGALEYGLLRGEGGNVLAATVGWVHFYMPMTSEADMDTLLEIVRSYKVEQCGDCERPLPAPPSNNGMHPTANSAALMRKTWPSRRCVRGG